MISAAIDWPKDDSDRTGRALNVARRKNKRTETRSRIAKLSPGEVIKLSYTVKFGGISADTFTLIEFRKRTPIFAPVTHPAFLCRLRAATLAGATIEL